MLGRWKPRGAGGLNGVSIRLAAVRLRTPRNFGHDNEVQIIRPLVFLVIATSLEVTGDALVRLAIYKHAGWARLALVLIGAALLLGYGVSLNLAPLEFRQVVGLYIAILFIVWQIINAIFFGTFPDIAIALGGALIVAGGLIVTFWTPSFSK